MATVIAGLAGALLVIVLAASPARADVAGNLKDCLDSTIATERMIQGCTAVVDDAAASARDKFRAHARRSYLNMGDYKRASSDASAAIDLEPQNGDGYAWRADIYSSYQEYDKAIADLNLAIRHKPNDIEALAARAYAYMQVGKADAAIADDSEIIRLKPGDAQTFYNRGVAYQQKGDIDRARDDFNRALALDRTFVGDFKSSCFKREFGSPWAVREPVLVNWPACDPPDD